MSIIVATAELTQDHPVQGGWRCNSWKTINGHNRQSNKYASCLFRNDRPYHQHVVISIDDDLTIDEHAKLWSSISRQLRQRQVTAFYVREFNGRDRIHYHLLTTNYQNEDIYKSIETDFVRVHVEPVKDRWAICRYIVKCEEYEYKRVYFHQDNTLVKIGVIQAKGKTFWSKPAIELWKEIIVQEQGIAVYKHDTYYEAIELHHLVEPSISFPRLWRHLALLRLHAVKREERLERRVVTSQFPSQQREEVVVDLVVVANRGDSTFPTNSVADQGSRTPVIPCVPVLGGEPAKQIVNLRVSSNPSVEPVHLVLCVSAKQISVCVHALSECWGEIFPRPPPKNHPSR